MKFTNSPFTILDKNMNALDYQIRNLKYEDYWRREGESHTEENFKKVFTYILVFLTQCLLIPYKKNLLRRYFLPI